MKKTFLKFLACAMAALVTQVPHAAEPYPSKPMRMITSVAPGVPIYRVVRLVADGLSTHLGQTVVVETLTGPGVAAQAVARAQPDGYTLLHHFEGLLTLKHLQPGVPYDPIADFTPVARLGSASLILVAQPKLGVASIEELIARIRAAPGRFNYGSSGIGSSAHTAGAVFLKAANLDATHVPFKTPLEYLQALVRGDVDFAVSAFSVVFPLVQSGQVRALGVTSAARLAELPETPTLREVLKSDLLVQESWGGLSAPARTPPEITAKLHAAVLKTISDPVLRQQSDRLIGGTKAASPSTSPEEFAAFVRRENDKWREIIRISGARAD